MTNKLTIDDFVKNEFIETADIKKPLIKSSREEINHFIATKEARLDLNKKKPSFYEIVPKTKLEAVISKVLHKTFETFEEKSRRLIFQDNFDTKMRRIKRIKSKAYRKVKRLAKNDITEEEDIIEVEEKNKVNEEDTKEENYDDIENAPIFTFKGNEENANQHEIVKLAFKDDMGENEADFVAEKEEVINENTPKVIETILPGWGDWAGPGLEIVKTKYNTIIETKEGINYAQRKDFGTSHVIINNENDTVDDKFKCKLPYGYTKEDYKLKLSVPVSKECNTSRIYKKILRSVTQTKAGENIEPFKYEPEN